MREEQVVSFHMIRMERGSLLHPETGTSLDHPVKGDPVLVEDLLTLRVGVLLRHHSRVRTRVTCLQLANAILALTADIVMINLLRQLLPLLKRHSVLLIALRQTRSD